MLVMTLFVALVGIVSITAVTNTVVRSHRDSQNIQRTRQSYSLAESGIEDALYRLKNSMTIDPTETLTLGSNSATTQITTVSSSEKTISSVGEYGNIERSINASVITNAGTSFIYGVQVGQGGLTMSGSGTINGNVYANGPISGDSSSAITGTATSGNSPALTSNQSNGTGIPAYNVVFGNANGTQDIAQSFQIPADDVANKVELYIKRTASAPSNATVKIMNDNAGSPGSTVIASGTLSAGTVTTNYGWISVAFSTNPILSANTTYWIVVDGSTNSTKYYTIGAANATYSNGLGKIGQTGGSWNNTSPSGLDYYFNFYTGGVVGKIFGSSGSQWNQLHIGTGGTGSAWANTINYTNATGTLNCNTGTGNNKSCTPGSDPVYKEFPISESNMDEWKNEGLAGGVHTGNYSVGWAGATLGPKKIVGNLDVSGGGTLTITGTLWVTGSVTLSGGGKIKMATGYGANDGIIISEGPLTVSGGGLATGSGTTGSYIMMITTNNTSSAASISGGAGAVIVYAPYGTINISGGASLKEATGYAVNISGGSTLTYESGLADLNFSTGPSGSWEIQSWKEAE